MKLIASILLILTSASAFAWDSAEQAIYEYLKYDANGGRLGGSDWGTYVSTYIAVEGEYYEPAYDMATIITSYTVSKPTCKNDSCTATVTYSLAATNQFDTNNLYDHPGGGSKKIEFTAQKNNNQWRVSKGMSEPHILVNTYINHMARLKQNGL